MDNDGLPCVPFESITYPVAEIIGCHCVCMLMPDIVRINFFVSEKQQLDLSSGVFLAMIVNTLSSKLREPFNNNAVYQYCVFH